MSLEEVSENNNVSHFNPADFGLVISPPFDNLMYYKVGITLPQFNATTIDVAFGGNSRYNFPAPRIDRSEFMINFKLDRYWDSYLTIWEWSNKLRPFNGGGVLRNEPDAPKHVEMTVLIKDGEKTPVKFILTECYPTLIPSISMSHDMSSSEPIVFPVMFRYEEFLVERHGERRHFI